MPVGVSYRIFIYSLLYLSFALGLPPYHYATALMIALIVRHRRSGGGLFTPVFALRSPAALATTATAATAAEVKVG